MSGHRQAAVALHGLLEADRALILSDLPEADRQILRSYLGELDELGFDSTATAAATAASGAAPRAVPPEGVHALDQVRATDVHVALQGEPATLVAQLLSIRPWPWRAAYLALQTGARRDQLRAAAPDGAIAPARGQFLLEALQNRMKSLPPSASAPVAHGAARPRWAARLTRLTWPWTR